MPYAILLMGEDMAYLFSGLGFVFVVAIYLYNRFIRLENLAKEAWSDVNVQLKRRYSLIPNLVEIVKGYMKYEAQTLNEIVSLRNTAINQTNPQQKEGSENKITEHLMHVFAVAEKYPDVKANEQFKELATNLVDIENTLQLARRYYNATVRDYNIAIHSFPSNLVASFMRIKEKTYFEIADFETKNIKVQFNEE